MFINDDCTESFYCLEAAANGQTGSGCDLSCPDGQRVWLDILNEEWRCIDREDTFICAGQMQVG